MDDQELGQKLAELEKKIDAIYVSAEKTRRYFLAMMIVTAAAFVLPLIGLLLATPSLISNP